MHVILVWFDHLPYGVPGCCGNTEADTPGFDRFAAGSVTCHNCLIDNRRTDSALDLVDALARLHADRVSVRVLAANPTHLSELLNHSEDAVPAVEMLNDDDRLLQQLTSAAEQAAAADASNDANKGGQVTLVSMPGVVTPDGEVIGERLDSADRLLERLALLPSGDDGLLLVTAGGAQVQADDGGELNERMIHVPLLGRVGQPLEFGVHSPSLVALGDVPAAILCWMGLPVEGEPVGVAPAEGLLRELSGERVAVRQQILLRGPQGTAGVRTAEWYLQARFAAEPARDPLTQVIEGATLFWKPDDLWDQLDVASQSPGVVEELSGMLLGGIGKTGDGPEKHR